MILKTCFLLVLSVALEVSGASYSNVFVQTGPEAGPALEYLQYGAPYSYGGSQVASYSAPSYERYGFEPFGQAFNYRTATPSSIYGYPEQTIAAIAPAAPTPNILTYRAPSRNLPLVYGANEPTAYSYVLVNNGAGQDLKLSDGEVIRSLFQPEGQYVQYVADDNQGLNAIFKTFIPKDPVAQTETVHHETVHHESVHHAEPCHDVKSEALIAQETSDEGHEEHHGEHEHIITIEHTVEHEPKHAAHHEDHEGHETHHEGHEGHAKHHEDHEAHAKHHEDHEAHEKHHEGHEGHETHHEDHEAHEKHHEEHEGHEKHHEAHAGHSENHEARHGGHEDPTTVHEIVVHGSHSESGSHESAHHTHTDHIIIVDPKPEQEENESDSEEHSEIHIHTTHEDEQKEEEEEPETETEKVESHHGHTHEAIVEVSHEAHENHNHEGHVATQVPINQVPALVGNNVYISYNDFIKCVQAALAKGTHPYYTPTAKPTSPLTYLIFNKPC